MHACIHTCIYAPTQVSTLCMRTCVFIYNCDSYLDCMYVPVCLFYIYIYIYVCVCVCDVQSAKYVLSYLTKVFVQHIFYLFIHIFIRLCIYLFIYLSIYVIIYSFFIIYLFIYLFNVLCIL